MTMRAKLKVELNIPKNVDSKKLAKSISEDMEKTVKQRFRTSKAPDGTKWQPVDYRNGKPLMITGSLRDSMRRSHTSNRAVVGTNDIRARIHQYGGEIKAKNVPYLQFKIGDRWVKVKSVKIRARPYIGFNQKMIEQYKKKIGNYFKKALDKKLGGAE